ncbi:MAG TPA: tetratricopeptide repeat protein [Rhizomicrobium sp.]|nr:tetratricopeptide repeat protein [Rhizomicrobium sp.]
MAEEDDAASARAAGDAAAVGIAMNAAPGDEARAYLREQTELAKLQKQNFVEQNAFELSHLRWRRFNDQMRGALQLMLVAVGALIVIAIGAAIWSAAHDGSLVIEAFSVPSDLAARGITGEAVAAQLQDKLTAMQTQTDSARPADSYANNWGTDIKIQIPDTGVSISEFYRMLAAWFGHQTHISGEVYRTPDGLAVTVRASGNPGDTVEGSERDLPALMQKAAEAVYARTQEFRFAIYLTGRPGANGESTTQILRRLAQSGSVRDRIWAYMGIGTNAEFADPLHAPEIQAKAVPLAPRFALPYQNIADEESWLGHDQAALAAVQKNVALLADGDGEMSARARAISLPANRAFAAEMTGDYVEAQGRELEASLAPNYAHIAETARWWMAKNRALLHETAAARDAWNSLPVPPVRIGIVNHDIFEVGVLYDLNDWNAVIEKTAQFEKYLKDGENIPPYTPAFTPVTLSRQIWPYTAAALAQTGDMKGALALIGKTPLDCDLCVRMRGNIAALNHDWSGAAHWFAMVSARAPSIPFADTDWGAMLLQKGDYDGAIAKFAAANRKSPHYADPLQMWGEALMAQNRSDLALAKFAEADKDAPNWGRLHLKWGEALWWSGRKDEARKQYAIAAGLDLAPSDRSELARVRG